MYIVYPHTAYTSSQPVTRTVRPVSKGMRNNKYIHFVLASVIIDCVLLRPVESSHFLFFIFYFSPKNGSTATRAAAWPVRPGFWVTRRASTGL